MTDKQMRMLLIAGQIQAAAAMLYSTIESAREGDMHFALRESLLYYADSLEHRAVVLTRDACNPKEDPNV